MQSIGCKKRTSIDTVICNVQYYSECLQCIKRKCWYYWTAQFEPPQINNNGTKEWQEQKKTITVIKYLAQTRPIHTFSARTQKRICFAKLFLKFRKIHFFPSCIVRMISSFSINRTPSTHLCQSQEMKMVFLNLI